MRRQAASWRAGWPDRTGARRKSKDSSARLAAEIAQDGSDLLTIMASLGISVRAYKVGAAWIGEKLGRLKFNGRLLGGHR